MSKIISELIRVHQNKDSMINAFIWRKHLYRALEAIGWWREPSKCWDGKTISLFARVNAINLNIGIYELCMPNKEWLLSRALDKR